MRSEYFYTQLQKKKKKKLFLQFNTITITREEKRVVFKISRQIVGSMKNLGGFYETQTYSKMPLGCFAKSADIWRFPIQPFPSS